MTRSYSTLLPLLGWLPFFLFSVAVAAQSVIIEGQVRDHLGRPVDFANVYAQMETDSSAILAFDMTDPKGHYRLEVRGQPQRLVLTAGKLSYEKGAVILIIPPGQKKVSIIKDIELAGKAYRLQEVIVRTESPPVVIKKDTIIFKAAVFTDGTEEVVEDLLRRLPGVEISETGAISINGRSIEKVLVEHDDLFGKGYKLLTQNMSADVVDKVEVLDRYSENPLLKDIEDSEQVALNLVLREDRKSTFFGNADLGYGPPNVYEKRGNFISFRRKTKYYLFSNFNNVGKNPADDFLFRGDTPLFNDDPLGEKAAATALIALTQEPPSLRKERYHQNNAEFASLNFIYNPSNLLKFKGLAFLDFDELRLRENSLWQYAAEGINIREEKNFRNGGRAFSFKLDGIYQPGEETRLIYTASRLHRNSRARRHLTSNQRSLAERLKEEAVTHQHRLTFTRKLDDRRALQVFARHLTDDRPQKYRIDNFLPGSFFPGQTRATDARQHSRHRLAYNGLLAQYLQNINDHILDIRLAYTHTAERFYSDLRFSGPDGRFQPAGKEFNNDASLHLGNLFASLKYQQPLSPALILSGTLELHYIHALLKPNRSEYINGRTRIATNALLPLPKARLTWKPDDNNRLLLAYSRGLQNTSLPNVFDRYILNDYRNLKTGTGQFNTLTSHYLLLNYTYGGWSEKFLINANLTAGHDDRYLSTNFRIHPDINTAAEIIMNNRRLISLNVSVDRFVESLTGNFKLKTGLSGTSFENILNDRRPRAVRNNTFYCGGEWRSAFEGAFNFHLGTNWEVSFVRRPAFQRNATNFSFLDLLFDLSETLSLRLKQDLYYFPNLSANRQLFFFSDVDLRFTPIPNALTLKISGRNLLDTSAFSTFHIDDVRTFQNRIVLFPRYLLLKVNFRF